MEKKVYFLIIGIVVIIIIGVVFLAQPFLLSPEGNCEIISYNGDDKKIDIVFLTDGVSKSEVESYSKYLVEREPFSSHKDKFNFYYAGNVECELYQENILYCYSRELIKKAAACPDDYIVVLSEYPSKIRSSAYINVISINTNQPDSVLLHEFGHVFANLADEYVPSIIPRGAENCEKNCDKFKIKDECYEGCSKSDYFRSSHNSVMRTLGTKEYKTLNTQIIEDNLNEYY